MEQRAGYMERTMQIAGLSRQCAVVQVSRVRRADTPHAGQEEDDEGEGEDVVENPVLGDEPTAAAVRQAGTEVGDGGRFSLLKE